MTSAGKTTLEGLLDGVKLSSDPLGMLLNWAAESNTVGGRGWHGTTINGEHKREVDNDSILYKGGKVIGTVTGGAVSYATYGAPQAIAFLYNWAAGGTIKQRGYQKLLPPHR